MIISSIEVSVTTVYRQQNPSTLLNLNQHLKLRRLNFINQQVNENAISHVYVCSPGYNFKTMNLFIVYFFFRF